MSTWEPSTLCRCVGSNWIGYTTAALSIGVCIWYAIITHRWYQASLAASPGGRKVWQWLAIVFVLCSWSGYGTLALMLVAPKVAISLRLCLLLLQNVACPIFLWHASALVFTTISHNERLGQSLRDAMGGHKNVEQMSQKHVEEIVKAVENLAVVQILAVAQAKELVLRSEEIQCLQDQIRTLEGTTRV